MKTVNGVPEYSGSVVSKQWYSNPYCLVTLLAAEFL